MIFKEISLLDPTERSIILNRSKSPDSALVKDIIDKVKREGDKGLKELTKKFDGVVFDRFRVSADEFKEAQKKADPHIVKKLEEAFKNILAFHENQFKGKDWQGTPEIGTIIRPIENVGCYIPGGRAPYPSTVLMAAVPAKVAGSKRIACATPPGSDGRINEYILSACAIAGVDEVYKIGGAQAIAALAYGTETIPKVDLIVGPGNIYVTAAKKVVYGDVGVDMLAGPSEVLIIADSTSNPDYIVADILAQAEHDPNASCILITTSDEVAKKVKQSLLEEDTEKPPGIENTAILIAESLEEAAEFANEYAPEHLEILSSEEEMLMEKITNAGSIFLGPYSPVAAGDYASGPNHILPTGGCARFQSGLNVETFIKKISVQRLSKERLEEIKDTVTTLAETEGLRFHSESVKRRLEDEKN
jgi:histidinol dehydrogenase